MKLNTLVQLNNLNVQMRNVASISTTELEISVWGLIGIVTGTIALSLGLFWFINWLIER